MTTQDKLKNFGVVLPEGTTKASMEKILKRFESFEHLTEKQKTDKADHLELKKKAANAEARSEDLEKKQKITDDKLAQATKLNKEQAEQIAKQKLTAANFVEGYGSFTRDKEKYIIVAKGGRFMRGGKGARSLEPISAQKISESPLIQGELIQAKSGLIMLESVWLKSRERARNLVNINRNEDSPTAKVKLAAKQPLT